MTPPSGLSGTSRRVTDASRVNVASSPNRSNSTGTAPWSAATGLDESAMTTNRSRGGHELLTGVSRTAALDEPEVRIDQVGAIDRDVEALNRREVLGPQSELPGDLLGARRRRHAADVELIALPERSAGGRRSTPCRARRSCRPRPTGLRPPPPPASRRRGSSCVSRARSPGRSPGARPIMPGSSSLGVATIKPGSRTRPDRCR